MVVAFKKLLALQEQYKVAELIDAYQQISDIYRQHATLDNNFQIQNEIQAVAYALARMPATLGACQYVINELNTICQAQGQQLKNWMDMGSGPGTMFWPIKNAFPRINPIFVESNPWMSKIGKMMLPEDSYQWIQNTIEHLFQYSSEEIFDVISFGYVLNEIPMNKVQSVLQQAWRQTNNALIIIEPGTPISYDRLITYRQNLIDMGAFIAAPCGHNQQCPLWDQFRSISCSHKDWCHFAVNVERSSGHQQLKKGTLGHEHEKFTYLIATKYKNTNIDEFRILKPPLKRSGHFHVEVCMLDQIEKLTLSKKMKGVYKKARTLRWGDKILVKDFF